MNSNLLTRAQYLAFVTEWKSGYRELSLTQRKLKALIRQAQKDRNGEVASTLSWQLQAGKVAATAMLQKRAAMKIAARDAYLASKPIQSNNLG